MSGERNMNLDLDNFGKRLDECIKKSNLTNTQITKILGLSKNAIGNYKNNQIPNATILYNLSQLIGTSVEYLMSGITRDESTSLSPKEWELIRAYRDAAPGIQQATRKLLDLPESPNAKSSESLTG